MSLTLLVVDDSAVVRSMLIRTLRMSALPVTAVHQAESAEQALRILRRADVDVVLVDQGLAGEGGDGDALLDDLRADPRCAAVGVVMVIPDGALPGTAAGSAARGAIPLRSPFTPEQLRYAVLQVSGALPTGDPASA